MFNPLEIQTREEHMKILLISFENDIRALCALSSLLQNQGYEVKIIQGDPTSVSTLPNLLKGNQVSQFLENIYTMSECLRAFSDGYMKPDWSYLKDFEEKYCHRKNLLQLVMTDPIIFNFHHYRRPYYTKLPFKEAGFAIAELLLKWLENIFADYQPEVLFTIGNNYFVKNAACFMAAQKKCQIIQLVPGRMGTYWFPHSDAVFAYEDHRYQDFLEQEIPQSDLREANKHISEFLSSKEGLYEASAVTSRNKTQLFTITSIVKKLFFLYKRQLQNLLRKGKITYRKDMNTISYFWKGDYIASNKFKIMIYHFRIAINQIKYLKDKNSPFTKDIPTEDYLLFPLHTLPESSTLTLSKEYYEADLIRFISKEMPAGMLLLVKENPNMIGERFWSFYQEIDKLPNVVLLDPIVSTQKTIKMSKGVVGISGTALLEAIFRGKPIHCFGNPEFLPIVNSYGFESFASFAKGCLNSSLVANQELALKHIQYVLNYGVEIDSKELKKGNKGLNFQSQVNKIFNLIQKETGERNPIIKAK